MIKVINVISDTNIGGAGRVIINMLKNYDRERFDIKVMLPAGSKLIKEIEAAGSGVLEVDGIADKSLDLSAVMEIMRVFKAEKPDIVHTHASMSAKIAARLYGAKTVYTRHSVFPQKKLLTTFPGKQINGMINSFLSSKIIAVAEAARQNIIETGVPKDKIDVILNGVDGLSEITESAKIEIRNRYGIKDDELVVSMIARLEKVKGHKYFIEAARSILETGKAVRFLIAGTGNEESYLKQFARDIGAENVIFTGFIEDVNGIMNITDIIANCSFGTEATSMALLEAMSLGKPAVVSDFGGNADVIEDGVNGYVVPAMNAEAFMKAVLKLHDDTELMKQMQTSALNIYRSKFTSKIMTRNIEDLYTSLLLKN